MILEVVDTFLDELYSNRILLRYNAPPPRDGVYGWLKRGLPLSLESEVRIEQNSGLYGGQYRPLVGGRKSSGFAPIGAFSYSYSALPETCSVGRYCSISADLKFIDSMHPTDLITTSAITFRPRNSLFTDFMTKELRQYAAKFDVRGDKPYPKIGNDVWIGANVTLAMGIHLGDGCVVATNSTVTRDVPPYAIVGGIPAKILRYRFDEEVIDRLVRSEWWNLDPAGLFETPDLEVTEILRKIENGEVNDFQFRSVTIG